MSLKDDISDEFQIDYGTKLGSGAFGEVFRGIWKKKNNSFVAVKRIKEIHSNAKKMMEEQIEIMKNLEHDNILRFLGIIESNKGTFLVIQYCQGGSLDKEIQKGIPQLDCFIYLKMIVDAMCVVNDEKHIHRDIKPQNILFTKQKVLKICDFGLARKIVGDDPNKIQKFSAKGTPLFSAPQILRHKKYSAKCDVWSTGVVLVQMLTRKNPFNKAKNLATLINLQDRLNDEDGYYVLEDNCNQWFKQIIKHMIQFDEEKRWSFYQIRDKINQDYQKVCSYYGGLIGIKTTKITPNQNLGTANQTGLNLPQTKNIDNKIKILKQDRSQTSENKANFSQIQKKLLTRQQNKKHLIALKAYIEFLYNRGKLFADVGTKYFQAKQNPKANGYKFIVLFFCISIFLKSIEKIFQLISKQTEAILPDDQIINYDTLDQTSRKQFIIVQKDYQKQLTTQLQKFSPTINQIYSKMTSDKYKEQYKSLIQNNSQVINDIIEMKNQKSSKKVDYFEITFRSFFKRQCIEKNHESLNQSYLRIYWLCLNLISINKFLPLQRYKDNYIINQLIDDSSKLSKDKIKISVANLHNDL